MSNLSSTHIFPNVLDKLCAEILILRRLVGIVQLQRVPHPFCRLVQLTDLLQQFFLIVEIAQLRLQLREWVIHYHCSVM